MALVLLRLNSNSNLLDCAFASSHFSTSAFTFTGAFQNLFSLSLCFFWRAASNAARSLNFNLLEATAEEVRGVLDPIALLTWRFSSNGGDGICRPTSSANHPKPSISMPLFRSVGLAFFPNAGWCGRVSQTRSVAVCTGTCCEGLRCRSYGLCYSGAGTKRL